MPRAGRGRSRRSGGLLELLTDLVAKLPWWVGVALAAVSYAVLSRLDRSAMSAVPAAGAIGPQQIQHMVWGAFGTALINAGQYALPFVCLLGAAVSAWRRHHARRLADTVTRSETADVLNDGMTWREFERLVGEAFRRRGYRVEENDGPGPDGGIDLRLRKGGELYLVQCKQWKAFRVGLDVVQRHFGVMAAHGAAGGFVVTAGRFTDEARAFAVGRNIALIEGSTLHRWLRPADRAPADRTDAPVNRPLVADTAEAPPRCPKCGAAMVPRVAMNGERAGLRFWGCSDFQKGGCRGTRAI